MATLGPACDADTTLARLLHSGVDVVRLNLSHGVFAEHAARLARVRTYAAEAGRPIGVLADLPGPKIRAGQFPEGGVSLPAGTFVRLSPGEAMSTAESISVDYATLLDDIRTGDRLIIGDGAISLRVVAVGTGEAEALIESGGWTQGRPGVHLPSARMRLATPTADDLVLAEAAAAAGVDFIAVSFVRAAADMRAVADVVAGRAQLVAKIETTAALDNLGEILDESDAVMVARGDLGIDCPLEDVPHLQKTIIGRCVEFGVPVITATQMLESMITAPSPTRAEVTDIANAIFDGTDALMLSGETAIGHNPPLVVATMSRIAERAEREARYRDWAARLGAIERERWDSVHDQITAALTHAAAQAAEDVSAAAILCCTSRGRTAKAMARFRPEARLLALSPNPRTLNAMTLSWGVEPVVVDMYDTTDQMVWYAVERSVQAGLISQGDIVVVLAGSPDRLASTAADVLRIVSVQ